MCWPICFPFIFSIFYLPLFLCLWLFGIGTWEAWFSYFPSLALNYHLVGGSPIEMNRSRPWNILCWNVRGANSDKKWNSIRDKIVESKGDIVCLQETKKEVIDQIFLRNICPQGFDAFAYKPAVGASGGILTIWKSAVFKGVEVFQNDFALSVQMTSSHNNSSWLLTTIYAPCTCHGKRSFLEWFRNYHMPVEQDWLVIGDFNLIRRPEDRNREGGDQIEMFLFNEAISTLNLIELPLHGRHFTWTNKQNPPLLERLDWFFTNTGWTEKYPNTSVKTLPMETSDHWPCSIEISTSIPRNAIFRFENHWIHRADFIEQAISGWSAPFPSSDPAKLLSAKFKNLRRVLKSWNASTPPLASLIENAKLILHLMDTLECLRDLTLV